MPPYLELAVAFAVGAHLARSYLDLRQLRELQKRAPPPALEHEFPHDKFCKIRSYALDKWRLRFLHRTCQLGQALIVIGAGALPRLWAAVGGCGWAQGGGEVAQSVLFALAALAAAAAAELPWSWYGAFAVEQRHGFNTMTQVSGASACGVTGLIGGAAASVCSSPEGTTRPDQTNPNPTDPTADRNRQSVFVSDVIKSLSLSLALVPPLVAGLTWILLTAGYWVALQLWLFLLAASAALLFAYPSLIAPLFNK